jgi:4-hydroxy-tetrahydrodipicolinate reductase
MGLEIQKCLTKENTPFRLVGGNSRKFEGADFNQGKNVSKELLAQALIKSEVDLILDFSTAAGNELLLDALVEGEKEGLRDTCVLVGTTGIKEATALRWRQVATRQNLTLLVAPNTSIGILLTVKAAVLAAGITTQMGFDIEIVEAHHRLKVDAPSGTANFIAKTLTENIDGLRINFQRPGVRQPGEIGVHAVRGGSIFGEHEVRIIGDNEEITISHRAFSRALFAEGALVLSRWLVQRAHGIYGLMDIDVQDLLKC